MYIPDTVVSVILPTYNEAASLPLLIPRIAAALRTMAGPATVASGIGSLDSDSPDSGLLNGGSLDIGDSEILVVDDASPDGTADRAAQLGAFYPIRVIRRAGPRCLSAAVVAGVEAARGDVVVVMDADGSHPPEHIHRLVRPVLDGHCEMALGSRYLPGGGCQDWPWYRFALSRSAGFLARGVTSLTDPTSGFFCVRRESVRTVEVRPIGWKIGLDYALAPGIRVSEVPFCFGGRIAGKSKANVLVSVQYLVHLGRLYRTRRRRTRIASERMVSAPIGGPVRAEERRRHVG